MKNFFHTTFSSLKIRNYRLYYIGQTISMSGTFLQALAQDWLTLQLTHSGLMLGLVSACQFLPMLILTPWGGAIADRFKKLNLLWMTQISAMVLSLILGALVLTGAIQIWTVFIFAICLGLTNSLDNPTRQAFVFELVGKEEVKNAVSLWAILISLTRIVGPAIAGILIATVGIGDCFIINGLSYIAVLIAFYMINTEHLHLSAMAANGMASAKGRIKEGFNYMKSQPILLITLVQMAIIGTITFEWQASMPLFAEFVLHGDAKTYAIITVATSIGMLFGGITLARTGKISSKRLVAAAFGLGVFTIIASFMSTIVFAAVAFAFTGLFMITFANMSSSLLQTHTDSAMRGRIMSFWSMAFQGSTAIGGPLIGFIGQAYGAQWALAVGGIAALAAGGYGYFASKKAKLF